MLFVFVVLFELTFYAIILYKSRCAKAWLKQDIKRKNYFKKCVVSRLGIFSSSEFNVEFLFFMLYFKEIKQNKDCKNLIYNLSL